MESLGGLLNYCSALRITALPLMGSALPLPDRLGFDIGWLTVSEGSQEGHADITFVGQVPIAESARAEHIGKAPSDIQGKEGPALLIVRPAKTWATVKLDDHILRNVVYIGMTIEYDGGQVFVNCVFKFQPNDNSLGLGKAIFASASTTFAAPMG
jgi:hypothetical protein